MEFFLLNLCPDWNLLLCSVSSISTVLTTPKGPKPAYNLHYDNEILPLSSFSFVKFWLVFIIFFVIGNSRTLLPRQIMGRSQLMYTGRAQCQTTWLHLMEVIRWHCYQVGCTWDAHPMWQRVWQSPSHSLWSSAGSRLLEEDRDLFALTMSRAWRSLPLIFLKPNCEMIEWNIRLLSLNCPGKGEN